ncbi:hypothetical protein BCR26_07630 [Enterococcus rivorum]|uniref:Uncharacterized protein n=1 Tax=Enterococcus rivorum TaxID=762845 RepID=A0A1E5L1C3_9ENTE|nr:hypothetical protein BCR26_07630 [Enterococcus rivorum]
MIDSVTGKKLTTAEKPGKASLLANGIIAIGVMVKGVLNAGKTQNRKSVKTTKKASGAEAKETVTYRRLQGGDSKDLLLFNDDGTLISFDGKSFGILW